MSLQPFPELLWPLGAAFAAAAAVARLLVPTRDFHLHLTGDHPDSGPQKLHTEATPRIGGLAVMAGLVAGLVALYHTATPGGLAPLEALHPVRLGIGFLPLFALGLVEDISKAVSVRLRMGVSLVAGILAYFLAGVRIESLGLPVIDFPTAWAASDVEYFDKADEVHDQWRDDALIATAFAPHAPYTVNDANFERVRMLADQLDIPVHLHLHETAQEVEQSLEKHGQRPIARLDRLGLVNERLIAIHMTQLTEAEMHLCAERGVSVVHCPESNLKLASGFCPACALERAGVNLAIGTDGCASNNDLDMFSETRTAALLAKAVAQDGAALDAFSALRAATLGGAKAIGSDDRVGSIEPGKEADLVCVDLSALETQPLHHVVSQLIYATGRQQVSDVWIAGRARLRQRMLVDIDIEGVLSNARQWRERIAGIRLS